MHLDLITGILKVSFIDLLLSGDNAVVISLACRNLDVKNRRLGMIWGAAGAITARIIVTIFAANLIAIPSLKIVGGLLLAWIGIKLLCDDDKCKDENIKAGANLWAAVRTIIIADAVMSLDNVIAVVAAANGHIPLIIFGLMLSIPIIVSASKLTMWLMDRFPIIITAGAGLIGYLAGEMIVGDRLVHHFIGKSSHTVEIVAGVAGIVLVVVVGTLIGKRRKTAVETTELNTSPE